MARGRKKGPPKGRLEVSINADLLAKFNDKFIDPFTGKITRGPRSKRVEILIRQYLETFNERSDSEQAAD